MHYQHFILGHISPVEEWTFVKTVLPYVTKKSLIPVSN